MSNEFDNRDEALNETPHSNGIHTSGTQKKRKHQDKLPKAIVDIKEKRRKQKEWKEKNRDQEALRLIEEKQRMDDQKRKDEEQRKLQKKKKKKRKRTKTEDESSCSEIGRSWTVSIALPSSILDNAQSNELKTYLVGQIARAAVVFNIDEIVVYDEYCCSHENDPNRQSLTFMTKILEYLECPQYLRRYLFPLEKTLRFAGTLNPLGCKHHLKVDQIDLPYREGVVMDKKTDSNTGSVVYMGLDTDVHIEQKLQPKVRVTVSFDPQELKGAQGYMNRQKNSIPGKAVSPSEPRRQLGLYWGYSVRTANSLSEALSKGPFEYDLKLGTSERGDDVESVKSSISVPFNHCIIVFGGVRGIEAALDADPNLSTVKEARSLFDFWLNTCPDQGSNTIRTEEAILVSLSALRPTVLQRSNQKLSTNDQELSKDDQKLSTDDQKMSTDDQKLPMNDE